MALTNLKSVEVTRLNSTGYGFGVKESNESGGKTYTTYWTVWAKEPHNLNVGDRINVSGFLSTKVGDPKQTRDGLEVRYVEHSLNSPRIEVQQQAQQQSPPAQQWSPNDLDRPF